MSFSHTLIRLDRDAPVTLCQSHTRGGAELIAQRAALVALAKSIKDDLEYLMEWGKIKPHEIHEIVAEIDALLSTIQAGGAK